MSTAIHGRTGPQYEENQAQYDQPQPDMATVQLPQRQAQIPNAALHGDTLLFVCPVSFDFAYLQYSRG